MKTFKLFFTAALLLCLSFSGFAQTEKGNFLLGGSSSFEYTALKLKLENNGSSDDLGKTTSLDFTPGVGYFLADNFAVGVETALSFAVDKDEDDNKDKYSSAVVIPFMRIYMGKGKVKPFIHGGLGPGWAKSKTAGYFSDYEFSYKLFAYEVSGGLSFFLNDKVSLEVGLGYASLATKYDDDYSDSKNITAGFGTSVGFNIFL